MADNEPTGVASIPSLPCCLSDNLQRLTSHAGTAMTKPWCPAVGTRLLKEEHILEPCFKVAAAVLRCFWNQIGCLTRTVTQGLALRGCQEPYNMHILKGKAKELGSCCSHKVLASLILQTVCVLFFHSINVPSCLDFHCTGKADYSVEEFMLALVRVIQSRLPSKPLCIDLIQARADACFDSLFSTPYLLSSSDTFLLSSRKISLSS